MEHGVVNGNMEVLIEEPLEFLTQKYGTGTVRAAAAFLREVSAKDARVKDLRVNLFGDPPTVQLLGHPKERIA